jgi:hypothetical protein
MDSIARALADPLVRGLYLGVCLALVVVPLLALWLWYRKRLAESTVDRDMAVRIALLTLLWMVVNAGALGVLVWANTVNGTTG